MTTKWELISEAERRSLERTPFGGLCSNCRELLVTEADFAKHFVLYDRRYLHLGNCPNSPS